MPEHQRHHQIRRVRGHQTYHRPPVPPGLQNHQTKGRAAVHQMRVLLVAAVAVQIRESDSKTNHLVVVDQDWDYQIRVSCWSLADRILHRQTVCWDYSIVQTYCATATATAVTAIDIYFLDFFSKFDVNDSQNLSLSIHEHQLFDIHAKMTTFACRCCCQRHKPQPTRDPIDRSIDRCRQCPGDTATSLTHY